MRREYLRLLVLTWCSVSLIAQTEDGEEEVTEDLAEYTLIFQTAIKKGAGTDDDVMLKMRGDSQTTGYPLRYRGTDLQFNTGRQDRFNVTDIAYIGPICSVELWIKTVASPDLWALDTLTIVDWKTDDKAVFNISGVISFTKRTYNRTDKADGKWTRWSDWSVCSGSCPTGSQSRYRSCSRPPPACGGGLCHGVTNETRQCILPDCSKQEETTTTDKSSTVSIIVPIVVAVFVIVIVVAVVVFKRKKKRDEELTKKSEKQEQVVEYDKMHPKGDGTYGGNNYVA